MENLLQTLRHLYELFSWNMEEVPATAIPVRISARWLLQKFQNLAISTVEILGILARQTVKKKFNQFSKYCLIKLLNEKKRCKLSCQIWKYLNQLLIVLEIVGEYTVVFWKNGTPTEVEVLEIIIAEQRCFIVLTFFAADSENMKNISAVQLSFRADQLWFSLNQRCSELKIWALFQSWTALFQKKTALTQRVLFRADSLHSETLDFQHRTALIQRLFSLD